MSYYDTNQRMETVMEGMGFTKMSQTEDDSAVYTYWSIDMNPGIKSLQNGLFETYQLDTQRDKQDFNLFTNDWRLAIPEDSAVAGQWELRIWKVR